MAICRIQTQAAVLVWVLRIVAALQASHEAEQDGAVTTMHHLRSGASRSLDGKNITEDSVLCRITVLEAFTMKNDLKSSRTERVVCIPIEDEVESDFDTPIDLPVDLYEKYEASIKRGQLMLSISGAKVVDYKLIIGDKPHFTVHTDPRFRHLYERHLQVKDTMTVAVIRVSTSDSQPKDSVDTLKRTLFGPGINFPAQYKACSSGKLTWKLADAGVMDVTIPNKIAEFSDDFMGLITAVQIYLKDTMGYASVSGLADKVIFCLAPGTGAWAASSSVGYWRAQMNNDWCLSLSASMHELGHTLGLLHAGKDGDEYSDAVGYMGVSYNDSDWPRKCFNGYNSDKLGWFSNRTLEWKDGDVLIKLAATTDFNKTAADENVIVNINNQFYLQYNLAEDFNIETQEKQNMIAITQPSPLGSQSLAGLSVGELYKVSNFAGSGKTLWIMACKKITGKDGADAMLVSIAIEKSVCASQQFSSRPSSTPTVARSALPSQAPSTQVVQAAEEPSTVDPPITVAPAWDKTLFLSWLFNLLFRKRVK